MKLPKIPSTVLAFISAVIFGLSLVVNRMGLRAEYSPLQYTTLSLLAASVLSLPFVFQQRQKILSGSKESIKKALIIGVMASGLGYLFLFMGQALTSTVNAAFISSLTVFFTLPFAWLVSRDGLTKKQLPFVSIILAGLYVLIVGFSSLKFQRGDLLVLLFAILLGFTNAYSVAPAREWGGGLLAYVRLIVGALFLLPIMMVMDPLTYLSFGWWIGSGFMMWIFVWSLYRSIEQMGATKTLLILSIYPVVAVFASVLILKETLVDRQIIGGGLVVLGVCLLMKSRGAKNK